MALAETGSFGKLNFLLMIKSFLIWALMLTIFFLVVGFPLIALMAFTGSLLAIALHSVLPVSAVLVVVGGLIGANALVIGVGAAVLSLKGVHPHEVTWLNWLRDPAKSLHTSMYAACPLTCEVED